MLSKAFKILLFIILLAGIAYFGVCIKANFIDTNPNEVAMPSIEKAQYAVTIEATGNTLLATKYVQQGVTEGSRIFILRGYWELAGREYHYRSRDIIIDEAVLGKVTISKRPAEKK